MSQRTERIFNVVAAVLIGQAVAVAAALVLWLVFHQ